MITLREVRLLRIVQEALSASARNDTRPHWAGVICPSCGTDYRSVSEHDPVDRAFPKTKIQKAGSAESMLRYCLSQRGWAKQYQRGQLSGQQHLELLEDVRQYGRNWLRHEAEQFARSYLSLSDGRGSRSLVVGSDSLDSQIRADKWTPGPEGFLYLEDKPSFLSNVGRFFRRVKNFVREHIVAGAMALLGPQPLTAEESAAAEREAQKQEQFFDRFHEELRQTGPPRPAPKPVPVDTTSVIIDVFPSPLTPGEFIARVESYSNAAWQAAQRISTQSAAQIFRLERRVLGTPKTEHCTDCPPLAEKGWVPIGTLPPIGETECNGACLCSFRYKEAPEGREYFRGRKGSVPAPPYPKAEPLPEEFANEVEMIAEPPGVQINAPVAGPPRSLLRYNPYHVPSGEHGGEFTTGGGAKSDLDRLRQELVDVHKLNIPLNIEESDDIGAGYYSDKVGIVINPKFIDRVKSTDPVDRAKKVQWTKDTFLTSIEDKAKELKAQLAMSKGKAKKALALELKQVQDHADELKYAKSTYFWERESTPERRLSAVLAHEVGHSIHTQLSIANKPQITDVIAKIGGVDRRDTLQVSIYGASHPEELVAELHAMHVMGRSSEVPEKLRTAYQMLMSNYNG